VGPDEHAVLLIEQGGMYSWSFPEEAATIPVAQGRLRRGLGHTTIKRLTFRVDVHATPVGGPATRSGLIAHLVYDRMKAFVLKYAAHVIVHEGLEYLESGARETLLVIDSLDPTAWRSVRDGVPIRFPQGRPARVLLLVHGTFSSTVGSYGGLASTPWGKQFIQAVKANYDIVLGFDHFTLKRDPAQNAQRWWRPRTHLVSQGHADRHRGHSAGAGWWCGHRPGAFPHWCTRRRSRAESAPAP
jgi:hypothetical protein